MSHGDPSIDPAALEARDLDTTSFEQWSERFERFGECGPDEPPKPVKTEPVLDYCFPHEYDYLRYLACKDCWRRNAGRPECQGKRCYEEDREYRFIRRYRHEWED